MKDLEKELEKSVWEIIIDLQREVRELEEENRKLKEINESQNEEIQRFKDNAMQDMREITELEIENKKLRETIKDHQLYEKKLEHRIIELEELLHWE